MRKIKFSWRKPQRALPRLIGLAALEYDETQRPTALHFLLPRVFMLSFCLLLYSYLAVCGLVYWRISGDVYNDIKYSDLTWIFWPGKFEEVKMRRGESYIRTGYNDLREERYWNAYRSLKYGLMSDRGNMQARQVLANLQVIVGRPDEALETLFDGVDYAEMSEQYLQFAVDMALLCEAYTELGDMLTKVLEKNTLSKEAAYRIHGSRLRAYDLAGRHEEGLAAVQALTARDGYNPQTADAEVTFLLRVKRPVDALALLDRLKNDPALQGRPFFNLRAHCYAQMKDYDAASRAIRDHVKATPTDFFVYRFAISQSLLIERPLEAMSYLETAFRLFSTKPRAIESLAATLAELQSEDAIILLSRCNEEAKALGLPRYVIGNSLVQACLKSKRWEDAAAAFAEMGGLLELQDRKMSVLNDWTTFLVAAVNDDTQASAARLAQYMTGPGRFFALPLYYEAALSLRNRGYIDSSYKIVSSAKRRYNLSRRMNLLFDEVDTMLRERRTGVEDIVDADGQKAAERLGVNGEDPESFEKLRRSVLDQDWVYARAVADVIRKANPDWLKDRSYEWELLRVRTNLQFDDMVGTMLSVQVLLLEHRETAARELARIAGIRWNMGKQDQASAIANAILQRFAPDLIGDRWLSDYAIRRELERSSRDTPLDSGPPVPEEPAPFSSQ